MFTVLFDKLDRMEAKVDRMEERLRLLEESFLTMRVIMEHVDSRTDQISKIGKVNTLISLDIPIIVVQSALYCRYTTAILPLHYG